MPSVTMPPLTPPPAGGNVPLTGRETPAPAPGAGARSSNPPPIGTPATAETPPLMVGLESTAVPLRPSPANPVVESFDEVTYTCKPEDTYAKISLQYYGTEEYGAALQKFNHRHARASEAVRRDGAIVPGEKIFIPPANVLERRHADAIPKKPAAGGAVKPASFNAPGTPPAAAPPGNGP
jgi:hypothetical protein